MIFTIGLLQDPLFPGPPELGSTVWRTVTIERMSRRTVRFILPEPYAPFLDYTTFGILPAHLLGGIQAADLMTLKFNANPVGSGPFQLERVDIEGGSVASMVLRQSSRYHGESALLDHIQFRFYPSSQAVLAAYAAGEVEGIAGIATADLPVARAFPDLSLFSAPTAGYSVIFLNLRRPDLPFFQEREVGQALLYALDRQQIIDQHMGGHALVAHSPFVRGTWAYDEDIPHFGYDPVKAGELLDSAGWVQQAVGDHVRRKGGGMVRVHIAHLE